MNRLIQILLYAGVSQDEFESVRADIAAGNRSSLRVFSFVSVIFLMAMFCASFVIESIAPLRIFYLLACVLAALPMAVAFLPVEKSERYLHPAVYLLMVDLFAFGIIIGTANGQNELSVTFIAFLLTVPLLFTDRPVRIVAVSALATAAFLITTAIVKDGYTQEVDSVDAVVFEFIGAIVCTYMMTVKIGRLVYANKSRLLSQTDILTGVKNRNCFEQRGASYTAACRNCLSIVYADVNGLHEVNNTQGHHAGDVMLQTVASLMQNTFGAEHTYRLGGDEFAAVVADEAFEITMQKMHSVQAAARDRGYHVAMGCHIEPAGEICFEELMKDAEERMFADKRAFYGDAGLEHRRGISSGNE